MKIVQISDLADGGAAIGCSRLHDGLSQIDGLDVTWIAASGSESSGAVIAESWPDMLALLKYRLARRFCRSPNAIARARVTFNEKNVCDALRSCSPDVVCVHNIHMAMSFSLLKRLPDNIPIIITLHDMWWLTGYCCFGYECEKYMDDCKGECPQMGKWGVCVREPEGESQERQRFLERNASRITLVGQSRWMIDCANRRFGERLRIEYIPPSLDTEVFRPLPARESRILLGLPSDKPVLLTGAQSFDDERKGARYLLDAVGMLSSTHDVAVVAFCAAGDRSKLPSDWIVLEKISDEHLLNMYYASADVFVMPSLAESFGKVYLESIAAGTPCVAFDVGGCTEAVRDGETGVLAKYKDTEDLARCIEKIITMRNADRETLRSNCRKVAVEEYAMNKQAERYVELFGEVVKNRKD